MLDAFNFQYEEDGTWSQVAALTGSSHAFHGAVIFYGHEFDFPSC